MDDPTVGDLMTSPVLTVEGDEPPSDVASAMASEGIKSVVVIDDDCDVDGIFTATDYMSMAASGTDPDATAVRECMTTGVVTISPEASAETAATRMVANDISHLPVVGDDRQVTGIVTTTDLLASLADEPAEV